MKTTKTDDEEEKSEDDLGEEEHRVTRKHVGVLSLVIVETRVVVLSKRDCLSIIRAFCFYYAALYKDEGNPITII